MVVLAEHIFGGGSPSLPIWLAGYKNKAPGHGVWGQGTRLSIVAKNKNCNGLKGARGATRR